jgi:hypothetical protein
LPEVNSCFYLKNVAAKLVEKSEELELLRITGFSQGFTLSEALTGVTGSQTEQKTANCD